jgi:hypothetical protein
MCWNHFAKANNKANVIGYDSQDLRAEFTQLLERELDTLIGAGTSYNDNNNIYQGKMRVERRHDSFVKHLMFF